jgi:hypothetical protein
MMIIVVNTSIGPSWGQLLGAHAGCGGDPSRVRADHAPALPASVKLSVSVG